MCFHWWADESIYRIFSMLTISAYESKPSWHYNFCMCKRKCYCAGLSDSSRCSCTPSTIWKTRESGFRRLGNRSSVAISASQYKYLWSVLYIYPRCRTHAEETIVCTWDSDKNRVTATVQKLPNVMIKDGRSTSFIFLIYSRQIFYWSTVKMPFIAQRDTVFVSDFVFAQM